MLLFSIMKIIRGNNSHYSELYKLILIKEFFLQNKRQIKITFATKSQIKLTFCFFYSPHDLKLYFLIGHWKDNNHYFFNLLFSVGILNSIRLQNSHI